MSFFDRKNDEIEGVRYAGYNIRLFANLIDSFLLTFAMIPILAFTPTDGSLTQSVPSEVIEAIRGSQSGEISDSEFAEIVATYAKEQLPKLFTTTMVSFLAVGIVFLAFWKWKNSTPGKMLLKIRIVDAKTQDDPSSWQYFLRFWGYIISTIPLGLGFIMIAFNKKKRGLHDFMAGTAVVHMNPFDAETEKKKFKYQTYFVLGSAIIIAIYFAMQ